MPAAGSPNPVAQAAVGGIELQQWAKIIQDPIYFADTLYQRFKSGAKTYPTANVQLTPDINNTLDSIPTFQVPMRIQSGAAITQGTGDGDAMGRGSGSLWIHGNLSPVVYYAGCEITWLAMQATNGKNRGMVAVRAAELKNSFDVFMRSLEALYQGDSSGMLDQIPTTATVNSGTGGGVAGSATYSSIVGLNNANQFTDQQLINVYPSEGGTLRGSFRVSFQDGVANTIWSTQLLPAGTTTGDYLMVAGSSGALGNSIAGIKTYQVNGNTGNILGIPRASYPGRLSTPTINLNGNAVNPAIPYRAQILIKRALGPDFTGLDDAVWYAGPGQVLQMTQLFQNVVIANMQQVKGDEALDMVKKKMVGTFGGLEVLEGYNATPGRIDLLTFPTWGITELKEPSLYEFGNGVTSMPLPDPNGQGWLSSSIFYYITGQNLFQSNMRSGCYVTNAAEPSI